MKEGLETLDAALELAQKLHTVEIAQSSNNSLFEHTIKWI